MKILIDMNLSPTWVTTFTAVGLESAHWSSIGDQAAADSIIMAYAKASNYCEAIGEMSFQ